MESGVGNFGKPESGVVFFLRLRNPGRNKTEGENPLLGLLSFGRSQQSNWKEGVGERSNQLKMYVSKTQCVDLLVERL